MDDERAVNASTLRASIDATTVDQLRAQGSFKWTAPGPTGLGAAVAEMDFGAAPAILASLDTLSRDAAFGYLSQRRSDDLAAACAQFQQRRYGWADVDPARVLPLPDVLKAFELAITEFSPAGSKVILPTPAYMPFLLVPGALGREIIQVRMVADEGRWRWDLDALAEAFRAGGHLVVLCNPHNPCGRVFTTAELAELTEVVDRFGGRVFSDEIHAPLVYPGRRHVPYASTSLTAAEHSLTAVSASKAWNLAGLKCAQVILTNTADAERWAQIPIFATHGAATPGVVASTAAYREGEAWLAEVLAYLDASRALLASWLTEQLPGVRYRPPEGTYLAWVDCAELDLGSSPGALINAAGGVLVVDGPACGDGGANAFRLNFATPQPVLAQMVERIAGVLSS